MVPFVPELAGWVDLIGVVCILSCAICHVLLTYLIWASCLAYLSFHPLGGDQSGACPGYQVLISRCFWLVCSWVIWLLCLSLSGLNVLLCLWFYNLLSDITSTALAVSKMALVCQVLYLSLCLIAVYPGLGNVAIQSFEGLDLYLQFLSCLVLSPTKSRVKLVTP